ncbi:MAG: hypothetical protein P8Q31_01165 [Luminiphilus sp.]|jgi:hypothetical protein|nr:hypothetical protein [Luminiphilus sp.]MDG1460105.1 hypothetical protein [Luminiphilus sp.]
MNIEYITDADYEPVQGAKPAWVPNKRIGPIFKCGSLTPVKDCAYNSCDCQSIDREQETQSPLGH